MNSMEPKLLWNYFMELSKIPRGSKQEQAAAQWVADQGKALGCEVLRDPVGNVIIKRQATPGREARPAICLQAHVDMVCEKNEGTPHDFLKDPIPVYRDGDLLKARGTTLGADNGIGVATALAVLASTDIPHGPIEVLVTIDEETGMTGAENVQAGILKAKYLLNLDSEEEGYLTIGCAGGIDTIATRKVAWGAPKAGNKGYRLKVSGLKGGHSGIDIANHRGNAIRFLARTLYHLQQHFEVGIAHVQGGNKRNAIPREAFALLALDPAQDAAIRTAVAHVEAESRLAIGAYDPGLAITLEAVELPGQVMSSSDAQTVVNTLFTMVHGVIAMSPDIPGLVQTSTNLGVLETKDGAVTFCMLHRSSIDASKMTVVDRVSAHCALGGFEARHLGGYPGWKPEPDSDLVKLVKAVHQEMTGKEMKVVAIHAGLECGIIGEKYPGMEMASIGPDMWDVHTPDEKVSISSVGRFWELLKGILTKM
ncbi:aminoacyl-histidine dipeptidase [Holophaga foetida]|uniref:aminoacyl-histidine dipeptidase n=1 Tax=Holophaga foetida TaxID=35839 RepID=UPI0002473F0D|nr:aminoacyl-histidine dipeptidase [Holophaga foetida]